MITRIVANGFNRGTSFQYGHAVDKARENQPKIHAGIYPPEGGKFKCE